MNEGKIPECVIVAVTAYDSKESEDECIDSGFDKISNNF
jgi:hypothetical protein